MAEAGRRPAATGKRRRRALAKAELWMYAAMQVQTWVDSLTGGTHGVLPPEQWPADDPLIALCRRYNLTPAELAGVAGQVAEMAEARAIRGGYDDRPDTDG